MIDPNPPDSTRKFRREYCVGGKAWVLKYIQSKYVSSFMQNKQILVSTNPGFTWGDAAYVTPIKFPYSTMMYGRVGLMGYLDELEMLRVYDAAEAHGAELYQEWITHFGLLFRYATMTAQPRLANRILRNRFKSEYNIDLVLFLPDQYNQLYVSRFRDHWFAVTEPQPSKAHIPSVPLTKSTRVKNCEWVALQYDEFELNGSELGFNSLVGNVLRGFSSVHHLPSIEADLHHTYSLNRKSGSRPPHLLYLRP